MNAFEKYLDQTKDQSSTFGKMTSGPCVLAVVQGDRYLRERRIVSVEQHYWFPAKRRGWGWGVPNAWQGWLVLAAFFVLLTGGALVLLPDAGAIAFVAYSTALSAVLVGVCWVKGEPPRGRWGGE